jgi:hypothetical protein
MLWRTDRPRPLPLDFISLRIERTRFAGMGARLLS